VSISLSSLGVEGGGKRGLCLVWCTAQGLGLGGEGMGNNFGHFRTFKDFATDELRMDG
jgi:hypothetical protein